MEFDNGVGIPRLDIWNLGEIDCEQVVDGDCRGLYGTSMA